MAKLLIIDTIGEGIPDYIRQQTIARELNIPIHEVMDSWQAIDLTMANIALGPGDKYAPPEEVYKQELDKIEQILQSQNTSMLNIQTLIIFDEDVEGCYTINTGLAVYVYGQTSIPPWIIGLQWDSDTGNWHKVNVVPQLPKKESWYGKWYGKMTEEITTQNILQAKSGDRFTIQNIGEEEFQVKAKALIDTARARGVKVGSVYHRPIKTGIIFVK